MKYKNIILFAILFIASMAVISGIVVYSFRLQEQLDIEGNIPDINTTDEPESDSEEGLTPSSNTKKNEDFITGSSDQPNSKDNTNTTSPVSPSSIPTNPANSNATSNPPDDGGFGSPSSPADLIKPDSSEGIKSDASPIVLTFAGDINLDENSKPVSRYDKENKGIAGVLSSELLEEMLNADIMMLNNEFAYSTRGIKTPDKSYTFRANPNRVDLLKEMGVDIVSLANNHALDYGIDALKDTFSTLEKAGIDYVGAGNNLDRAKAAIYYTIGDTRIAYLAASRVIFSVDWYATDTRPGMIGTYDPALLISAIKEAEKNSDFVVVYVHWGVERTNYPVKYQISMAKKYIDAGADAVIGCHPHVLQGMELYKGKPIAYSLGNYWFNNSNRETALLKLYLDPDGSTRVQLLPAMQKDTYTYMLTKEKERRAFYNFMEKISFGVKYDEEGFLYEIQSD